MGNIYTNLYLGSYITPLSKITSGLQISMSVILAVGKKKACGIFFELKVDKCNSVHKRKVRNYAILK